MKLHYLQALRAIAAWLVVADHALLSVTHDDPRSPLTLIAWMLGNSGVYIFFVVSGFIMVHISWDDFGRRRSAGRFLRRRVIRIVPLYWLATIGALAFHHVSATHGASAGLILSLLFIPYVNGGLAPILGQGWTLTYEMMFYAIFAMVLTFHRQIALPLAGLSLGGFVLAGLFLSPGALALLASPIVLWFVFGIGLGALWRGRHLRERELIARPCRFLEPFGDASYSTYLVHGLVLTMLVRIWTITAGAPSIWIISIGLVVVTVAGYLVHILIERPILRMTNDLWNLLDEVFGIRRQSPNNGELVAGVENASHLRRNSGSR
jgi:exopolysaccharide production protein ExoZ